MELNIVLKDIRNKIDSIQDAVNRINRDLPIDLHIYYYDTICNLINQLDYEIFSMISELKKMENKYE